MLRVVFFSFLIWIFSCAESFALPSKLRVKLFEAHGRIESVKVKGPFEIVTPGRQRFRNEWVSIEVRNGVVQLSMLDSAGGKRHAFLTSKRVVLQPLDRRGLRIKINRDNIERAYLGQVTFASSEILSEGKRIPSLSIVNDIPTSEYVASVVGSEAPLRAPLEALKAFAVLTISIVEHKGERDFVGDSTREQAYKGCEHATPIVFTAVKDVYKKRLLYKQAPIQVFFHSTCAGGTSSGFDIFGEGARNMPYLAAVKCVYCTDSPFWKEKTSNLPCSTFKNLFDDVVPIITKYDTAKRPLEVSFGEKQLSGYQAWLKIGREYGWGKVPGTRYSFVKTKVGNADYIKTTSSGAGHGVGLCQWGAVGLANRGKKCDEILEFYFPGCAVVNSSR